MSLLGKFLNTDEELNANTSTIDIRLSQIQKNILGSLDSTDCDIIPGQEQMKVFLRVRPLPTDITEKCFNIENEYSVKGYPPKDSCTFKTAHHITNKSSLKFTFSRIFKDDTPQKTIFKDVVLEPVREFIEGQNSLLFSYGTTSSGKTYTIQGNSLNVGVIPRTLDVLFNSITQKSSLTLKPTDFCSVTQISPEDASKIVADKNQLLRFAKTFAESNNDIKSDSIGDGIDQNNSDDHDLARMLLYTAEREREVTKLEFNRSEEMEFTIWISFAEIYNESIFDLLDPTSASIMPAHSVASVVNPGNWKFGGKKMKRTSLDLRMDRTGGIYIKGLRHVPVKTADEAYQLLLLGKRAQQVASTRLNMNSSRSHTVFTVTSVRSAINRVHPRFASVSKITFCDLAGSERTEKAGTLPGGARLKEACNINTSLLTLGRCIEFLRFNQNHRDNPKLVPYRDSKLTRLFQSFFAGKGRARMIVNINPITTMFDETVKTLKFSAIAQQVILEDQLTNDPKKQMSRFHQLGLNTPKPGERISIDWETPALGVFQKRSVDGSNIQKTGACLRPSSLHRLDEEDEATSTTLTGSVKSTVVRCGGTSGHGSEDATLLMIIGDLKAQVIELKEELIIQETKIRSEICQTMSDHMIEMENNYKEYMREQEQTLEEESERRLKLYIKSYTARKRRRVDDGDEEEKDENECDEESQARERLNSKIKSLEEELAESKDANDHLIQIKDQLQLQVTKLEFRICSQKTENSTTKHFEDSSVSFNIAPPTVVKSRFFEPVVSRLEENKTTSSVSGGELSVESLRLENHQLLDQMTRLQSTLNQAVSAKIEAEQNASKLNEEIVILQSKSFVKNETMSSFLRHEKELDSFEHEEEKTALELEKTIQDLRAQLTSAQSCRNVIENSLLEAQAELKSSKLTVERSELCIAELTSKLVQSEQCVASITSEKKTQCEDLIKQIKNITSQLSQSEQRIAELTKNLNMERETSNLCENKFQSLLSNTERDIERLTKESVSAVEAKNKAETDISDLSSNLTATERKLLDLSNENNAAVELNIRNEKTISQLTSNLANEKSNLINLKQELNSVVEAKNNADKEISKLTSDKAEVEMRLLNHTAEFKKRIQILEEQKSLGEDRIKELENSFKEAQDDYFEAMTTVKIFEQAAIDRTGKVSGSKKSGTGTKKSKSKQFRASYDSEDEFRDNTSKSRGAQRTKAARAASTSELCNTSIGGGKQRRVLYSIAANSTAVSELSPLKESSPVASPDIFEVIGHGAGGKKQRRTTKRSRKPSEVPSVCDKTLEEENQSPERPVRAGRRLRSRVV